MNAVERFAVRETLAAAKVHAALGVLLAMLIFTGAYVGLSVEQWLHPSVLPV